jgi:1,4-alpha-glucan branching enzyme
MTENHSLSKSFPRVNVPFVLPDTQANRVSLVGDFNSWAPDSTPMKRDAHGYWKTIVALEPGRYEYKFWVDGEWIPDLLGYEVVRNCYGTLNSVVEVQP